MTCTRLSGRGFNGIIWKGRCVSRGRKLQKGDEAVTDFNGKGVVRVAITDRREHAQSQSRVMYRVWPPLKGGNNETWYDADWFEPAPPNAGGNAT